MSEKRDSNPRPRPWQGRALPTELFSQDAKNEPSAARKEKGMSQAWLIVRTRTDIDSLGYGELLAHSAG